MRRTFVETSSFSKRVDREGAELLRDIQAELLKNPEAGRTKIHGGEAEKGDQVDMRKTKLGQELIAGLQEAAAHTCGVGRLRAATVEIPEPAKPWPKEKIVQLRKQRFGVSQPVFASLLSVTASTVRAWEQGQKAPSGAARRLLEVAEIEPGVFQRLARGHSGALHHARA
jgi:putative transcriptional regulator